ncbi:MerR family transcriptional regulator [Ruania zhangjianzhongii]|uniref:MerR family transcriptional regulator n=1 Tax=Ruania zhangjianzhongii TaxID=2603206 RepID=UPI001F16A6CB|nr:MerR family transcriptional regulator [Ruania zhangjianzhongii]
MAAARSGHRPSNRRLDDGIRLTVAAVAGRLGVAASTLRTWERRYGLGPSARTAGKHRRYDADDVTRLETMRRLTGEGVAPADAARLALGQDPDGADDAVQERNHEETAEVLDPLSLAAAAVEADDARLHRMIARSVGTDEVLTAWQTLVRPALDLVEARDHGDRPGRDPAAALGAALLAVIRTVAEGGGTGGSLLIHADGDRHLDAHVLAAELALRGARARVLRPSRRGRQLDVAATVTHAGVQMVVLLGPPAHAATVVEILAETDCVPFVVSTDDLPAAMENLPRARTLGGAVHEIYDLLSEQRALQR